MHKEQPLQFVGEVESLLKTALWPETLFAGTDGNEQGVFDARMAAYIGVLRLIARKRITDRQSGWGIQYHSATDWNERHNARRTGYVAEENKEELRNIARRVAIANMARKALNDPDNFKTFSGARRQYLVDIIDFVQQAPGRVKIKTEEGEVEHYVHGALVEAPTGFGKTALMGAAARILKVGYPIEGIAGDDAPVSLLITAPERLNLDQITGALGDKTFQRYSDGLRVGQYDGRKKEIDGFEAIGTTVDTYESGFRNNMLGERTFDLLMIDEAHSITGSLFRDTFLEHWQGPAIGFTATPDYHKGKDSRQILPTQIHHTDILTCIEDGILNAAQLFTIKVEPEDISELLNAESNLSSEYLAHEVLDKAAIDLVTQLVAEGRRGMIFCDQGYSSFYARELARKLRMTKLPDGGHIKAFAIGSFHTGQSQQVMEAYNNGQLDVITTVEMAKQAFNSEVDFVIIRGFVASPLKLKQIIGRGTRPSEKFPITVYVQLYSTLLDRNLNSYPLHEAFGYDQIDQGAVIGPRGYTKQQKLDVTSLPPYLQLVIRKINQKTVNEVFLKPESAGPIPEGFVPLWQIIKDAPNVPKAYAIRQLKAAGFVWHSHPEPGGNGRKITRYYEPAATDYFKDNPVLPVVPDDSYTALSNLPERFGLTYNTLRRIVEDNRIPTVNLRSAKHGQVAMHLSDIDVGWLSRIIEVNIPKAKPGDTTITALMEELEASREVLLNICAEKGFRSKLRRREDARALIMVSSDEAHILRRTLQAYPFATDEDMTRTEIANRFNLPNPGALRKHLKDEEVSAAVMKRVHTTSGPDRSSMRILETWSGQPLQCILNRLQRTFCGLLPADVVPYYLLHTIVNAPEIKIRQAVSLKETFASEEIRLPNSTYVRRVTSWMDVKYLDDLFGLRPGIQPISYKNLPMGPDDTDAQRIAYARYIQARVLPKELLVGEHGAFS